MNILVEEAKYGSLDVTQVIQTHLNRGHLTIPCNNTIFGDPDPGIVKTCYCRYKMGGISLSVRVKENEVLEFKVKSSRSPDVALYLGQAQTILELNGSQRLDSYLFESVRARSVELFVHDLSERATHYLRLNQNLSLNPNPKAKLIYGDLMQIKASQTLPLFDFVYVNATSLDQTFLSLLVGHARLKTPGFLYLDLDSVDSKHDYSGIISSLEEYCCIEQCAPYLWHKI